MDANGAAPASSSRSRVARARPQKMQHHRPRSGFSRTLGASRSCAGGVLMGVEVLSVCECECVCRKGNDVGCDGGSRTFGQLKCIERLLRDVHGAVQVVDSSSTLYSNVCMCMLVMCFSHGYLDTLHDTIAELFDSVSKCVCSGFVQFMCKCVSCLVTSANYTKQQYTMSKQTKLKYRTRH